ncbi:MAG: flagellar hook-associated protein FlgK [Allosphingosinicella sp.]
MSDLLNIGSSAVSAYRSALAAVGENVANAETPGYARRSIKLGQADGGGSSPDPIYRDSILFGGVTAVGVQRAWDSFRASEARYAASSDGRASVRRQWLTNIESALGDGPAGIGQSLTSFFNSGATLAATPADRLARSAMLTALDNVASAFRTTADALGRVAGGIADAARLDVEGVNGALAALHKLNGTIRVAPAGSTAKASLEDQRERLIDEIAARIDITATVSRDGAASLSLAGASGVALLAGTGPGYLSMATAADGRIAIHLSVAGTSMPLPATGGRLAGLAEMASAAADRRAALDALASDLVTRINAASADGVDGNGDPGADLLALPAGAASMRLIVSDPALIAAQGADGVPNSNPLALDALRGAGGFEDRWNAFVSDNAQSVAVAKSEAAAAASWRDLGFAALDEVTGIDLDREAAELLRFQQAYGGATRIIQVARETVNAILDLF